MLRVRTQRRLGQGSMAGEKELMQSAESKVEVGVEPWARNRWTGWVCASLGAATGLVMGLWSFEGPVGVPEWLGGYGATSRRLARLGHIAFFGIGILNLLLARELGLSRLSWRGKQAASWAMNFGNIFLPLSLFGAAVYAPLKYVMPMPALAVFVALVLAAYGARPNREGDPRW